MARILVVDDDIKIVRLVRAYLEQAGYHVLTAHDGNAALLLMRQERPDLVVLDLMMPGRDGWDVTRIVRGDPDLAPTPIIMLTARIDDTDKILGLELGADDYITKPFNPREVVARARAVLRRTSGGPVTPRVLQHGALIVDVDRHEVMVAGHGPVDLTHTEFELLRALVANPGRAFTRLELIEEGLGYSYEGLERTIDSHIKNLRRKIESDPSNPTSIQTVYG
ncbi:MAG: response regulator transcription factor, partial [Chloroflexi bacterium]|nr:response regulator transcription factor [Chloroflexota bacterium]